MTKLAERVETSLRLVAGAILLLMMLVTFVDVIGRYFLGQPLSGGHAIIQALVCVLIFTGLPLVARNSEHLRVELLDDFLPNALLLWRNRVARLFVAAFFLLLAAQFAWQAIYFTENGEYLELIRLPVAWLAWVASVCGIIAACLAVVGLQRDWHGPVDSERSIH